VRRTLLSFLSILVLGLSLAACGSSSSDSSTSSSSSSSAPSGQPGKGKPAVTLGDKNFTEEYTLGELYKQALEAKGFTINLKSNIGSSEITDKALTSGKIDMYPEYTGVIVAELKGSSGHPKSAEENYNEAKKWQESRGFTLTEPTPFEDKDVLATKKDFASKNGLKSIEDLKKLKSWSLGGPPENKTRYEGVVGLHEAYGLNNFSFKPLTIGLQYQALDQGKVDVATVFSTDGQLAKGKYALLEDPKGIFGYQNVAMVLKPSLLKQQGPAFEQTINAVSAKLTNDAMQQLNAAVDLNKLQPKDVAAKFLQANGLAG
jgi:osmoprotectant transport system substrate-binding protein